MIYKWPVFPTYAAYMFVYRRVISLNSLSFLSDHVNKYFSHTSFCKQHAGVDTQQVPRSFLHFPKNIRFWALTTIQPSRFDILPPRSRKYQKNICSWVVFTPSYAFHRRSRHLPRQRGIMEVFITTKIQFLLMTSTKIIQNQILFVLHVLFLHDFPSIRSFDVNHHSCLSSSPFSSLKYPHCCCFKLMLFI